jgi:tetratricopeptide (TPR) repeat protein
LGIVLFFVVILAKQNIKDPMEQIESWVSGGEMDLALEKAHTIQEDYIRNKALVYITHEMAKTGKTYRASELAWSIEENGMQDAAVKAMLLGIEQIEDEADRAEALSAYGLELRQERYFDRALTIAEGIEDVDNRSRTQYSLACDMAEAGYANLAVELTNSIEQIDHYVSACYDVGIILARRRETDNLNKLIPRLLTVRDEKNRREALTNAVHLLTAMKKFDRAMEVAKIDNQFRDFALNRMALCVVHYHLDLGLAHKTAEQINDLWLQSEALVSAVSAWTYYSEEFFEEPFFTQQNSLLLKMVKQALASAQEISSARRVSEDDPYTYNLCPPHGLHRSGTSLRDIALDRIRDIIHTIQDTPVQANILDQIESINLEIEQQVQQEVASTREIPSNVRQAVLDRDDYICRYCGRRSQTMEVDHVIPVVQGGRSTLDNLVTACRRCNRKKGGQTPSEADMTLLPVRTRKRDRRV